MLSAAVSSSSAPVVTEKSKEYIIDQINAMRWFFDDSKLQQSLSQLATAVEKGGQDVESYQGGMQVIEHRHITEIDEHLQQEINASQEKHLEQIASFVNSIIDLYGIREMVAQISAQNGTVDFKQVIANHVAPVLEAIEALKASLPKKPLSPEQKNLFALMDLIKLLGATLINLALLSFRLNPNAPDYTDAIAAFSTALFAGLVDMLKFQGADINVGSRYFFQNHPKLSVVLAVMLWGGLSFWASNSLSTLLQNWLTSEEIGMSLVNSQVLVGLASGLGISIVFPSLEYGTLDIPGKAAAHSGLMLAAALMLTPATMRGLAEILPKDSKLLTNASLPAALSGVFAGAVRRLLLMEPSPQRERDRASVLALTSSSGLSVVGGNRASVNDDSDDDGVSAKKAEQVALLSGAHHQ